VGKSQPAKNGGRKRRAGRRRLAPANELEILDGLLLRKIRITLNGEEREMTAFAAVLYQLLQKATAGDDHASRVLLRYQDLAKQTAEATPHIAFVDSDYTQMLTALAPEASHG
jgi:hypothetical protein